MVETQESGYAPWSGLYNESVCFPRAVFAHRADGQVCRRVSKRHLLARAEVSVTAEEPVVLLGAAVVPQARGLALEVFDDYSLGRCAPGRRQECKGRCGVSDTTFPTDTGRCLVSQ